MAPIPDTLDSISVLVCLADEDEGTELAHGLRAEGLDVLVAHRIKAAMRVMEKESPQAVVVEVATKAFDGFRVAQWASGRVLAIFLVAGRELTLMEDVEVLKAGAKEVFYLPLQAATIAASIRGGCGMDTQQALGPEAAAPKTRFSAPPSVMKEHHPEVPEPEPQGLVEWDTHVMGQVDEQGKAQKDAGAETHAGTQEAGRSDTDLDLRGGVQEMDTLVDGGGQGAADAAPSIRAEVKRQLAARRDAAPAPEPAVDPPKASSVDDDLLPYGDGDDATSSSLIDDLFDDPLSTPGAAVARRSASDQPKSRKFEAPPDDDLLVSGMMDELDEMAPDSIYGSARQKDPVSRAPTADPATTPPSEEAEDDEQTSPTAMAEGPATADIIAAFQGQSNTPRWIARGLAVGVVCASAWLGWLVVERMDLGSLSEEAEIPEVTAEEAAAALAREKLHTTLSEAAISHREGDFDAASTGYESALEQDAESHIAARGLAAIEMTKKDWRAIRKALNRLATIVPDDPSLALQQGLVLRELKQKEPSRAELRRFIDSTKPEDPRVRLAAQVYLSLTLQE